MKKALFITRLLKTILIVLICLSLILVITVDGNDDVTLIIAASFITLLALYALCALVEDLIQNQIDRQAEAREQALAKRKRIHEQCRNGFERRAN